MMMANMENMMVRKKQASNVDIIMIMGSSFNMNVIVKDIGMKQEYITSLKRLIMSCMKTLIQKILRPYQLKPPHHIMIPLRILWYVNGLIKLDRY